MTKADLIAKVAEQTGFTKKDAEMAVAAVFGTITEELAKGEKVSLTGFGTFEVKERAERMGHNPRNGEAMKIAASKAPVFKAGKALKEAVAK